MANEELKIIKQSFEIFMKEENLPKMMLAIVQSYTAPNAVVRVAGSSTNITLKNATNQTLVLNDKVVVVMLDGGLTNAFIGWKL